MINSRVLIELVINFDNDQAKLLMRSLNLESLKIEIESLECRILEVNKWIWEQEQRRKSISEDNVVELRKSD